MMRKTLLMYGSAAALMVGCSSTPPPEGPMPRVVEADTNLYRRISDSLSASNQARADWVMRGDQVEATKQARTTLLERTRLAPDTMTRDAATKSSVLRTELGAPIHFDLDRSQLQPEGIAALDRKVTILVANPGVRLQITGATDERGSESYNQSLGTRRAGAAKQYLVGKGIDAGRLDERSTGKMTPLDPGRGEVAWARNRRAEFMIVSADGPLVPN